MSPLSEHPSVGDPVADHLVGRRAQALRVAVVVERARVGAALDVELVAVGIDLVGRHARAEVLAGEAQDLGRHRTGVAHPLDHVGRLDAGLVPLHESPVSAYGGRPMSAGTSRIGETAPGSTRPSTLRWHRLYLRPLPHQHRSFACGSAAGGFAVRDRSHQRPHSTNCLRQMNPRASEADRSGISGGEAGDLPGAVDAAVAKPVVETARAALPELEHRRGRSSHPPQCGGRGTSDPANRCSTAATSASSSSRSAITCSAATPTLRSGSPAAADAKYASLSRRRAARRARARAPDGADRAS